MKLFPALLVAVALPWLAGCGEKSGSPAPSTNAADVNNPLVNAKRDADKTIDVSYLNQACQLYNVQEGRYPKTLDELTPKYVAKLPVPPLGYKLNYDAAKGEVTVVRQ
jgi:predicted small lipoprotein YifL